MFTNVIFWCRSCSPSLPVSFYLHFFFLSGSLSSSTEALKQRREAIRASCHNAGTSIITLLTALFTPTYDVTSPVCVCLRFGFWVFFRYHPQFLVIFRSINTSRSSLSSTISLALSQLSFPDVWHSRALSLQELLPLQLWWFPYSQISNLFKPLELRGFALARRKQSYHADASMTNYHSDAQPPPS